MNSENGVNCQVVFKRNHAKRNRIKRDLPVIGVCPVILLKDNDLTECVFCTVLINFKVME
jgi:hypothetical protein